jgi:putative peptidoglycan lipid II flippase
LGVQVVAACCLLAAFLLVCSTEIDWMALHAEKLKRIVYLSLCILASAALYFGALWVGGLPLRSLLRPKL